MSEYFRSQLMIRPGWFGKEHLQPHFSRNRNPYDLYWTVAPDEKCSHLFRRSNRCRESDDLEVSLRDPPEPLNGNRELAAPLVLRQLVHLIDNQEPDFSKVSPHDTAGQKGLEGLWCCDEHIRWIASMSNPLTNFRVPMSHGHPEVDLLSPPLQSIEKVSVQRAKRGHVENLDAGASVRTHQEPGEYWEDCGFGL